MENGRIGVAGFWPPSRRNTNCSGGFWARGMLRPHSPAVVRFLVHTSYLGTILAAEAYTLEKRRVGCLYEAWPGVRHSRGGYRRPGRLQRRTE